MAAILYPKFLFNGALTDESSPRIWPSAEELLTADGLFETIKVVSGKPAFFADHHARITASARALRMSWQVSIVNLRERCLNVIEANQVENGSVKIVVFREGANCGELIQVRSPAYSGEDYARGFKLKVQRDIARATGAAHKSTRYLKNLQAREDARSLGFDEALFVDLNGVLLEGAATNVFAVLKGELLTPPLQGGILPGVVRGLILRNWAQREAKEHSLSLETLKAANEVFVTNALLGVMPVVAIDDQAYPRSRDSITDDLMRAFRSWQLSSLDR